MKLIDVHYFSVKKSPKRKYTKRSLSSLAAAVASTAAAPRLFDQDGDVDGRDPDDAMLLSVVSPEEAGLLSPNGVGVEIRKVTGGVAGGERSSGVAGYAQVVWPNWIRQILVCHRIWGKQRNRTRVM